MSNVKKTMLTTTLTVVTRNLKKVLGEPAVQTSKRFLHLNRVVETRIVTPRKERTTLLLLNMLVDRVAMTISTLKRVKTSCYQEVMGKEKKVKTRKTKMNNL